MYWLGLFFLFNTLYAVPLDQIRNEALAVATKEVGSQYNSFKVSLANMHSKTKQNWSFG